MENFISVIIPSYNSYNTLSKTLEKFFEIENTNLLKEIIVVDSSDDELTKPLIDSFKDKGVICITSGVKVMPAIQRNIGGKAAKGKLLLFIDSDAFPEKNWLVNISNLYQNKGVLVGGGAYLIPDFQLNSKIAFAQYSLEFSEFLPWGKQRHKNMVPSCNLFCEKELFEKVGGFPEIRASEDSMFGYKINQFNNLVFEPSILVFHIFRENLQHYLDNQKLLGKYVFEYRKKQNPILASKNVSFLLLPVIAFLKFFRIVYRVLRADIRNLVLLFKSLPLFLKGFRMWMHGYIEGIRNI